MDEAQLLEAANDEGFKKNERHFLWQTALVEFQLGAGHDHRTTGIIDALTEEILTEASLLALEHVRERFQRTVTGAGHGAAMTAIVEQCVDRFLQHAFLIMDDHIRSLELQEVFETVVAVDNATIQVIEVGGSKTATFERNERTEIRRNDRQDFEDHPLGAGAGSHETLNGFQAFGDFLFDLLGAGGVHLLVQFCHGALEIHAGERIADGFCAHSGNKGIFTVFILSLQEFLLGQELAFFKGRFARIDHEVVLVVNDTLEIAGGDVEQETQTTGHALQEPDVRNGYGEFDMTHAVTANT